MKRSQANAPAIAYRIFAPQGAPQVAVLMTIGYFENQKRYREVVERWNDKGILVAIYDLRGHGLSEGPRGFIERFDDYLDDARDLLTELDHDPRWKQLSPPMLFGHSLGGLISIHTALRAPDRIGGLALSSPYLELAQKVPAPKLFVGKLLSRFAPSISLEGTLKGKDCTHDLAIAGAYDHDPMNFRKANVRWFTEAMAAQKRAFELAHRLNMPLFCLQAGEDRVTLPAATERFMERVSSVDRQYLRLPGLFHEILNETDRATWIDKFATALVGWRPMLHEASTTA
ncbi:MAG TPA: lysophospholipase [Polyangiaceae bacterium]|nr:lysophospholipase [Polyangiaceae bacterium]